MPDSSIHNPETARDCEGGGIRMTHAGKSKAVRGIFYLIVFIIVMIQIYPIFWVICSSLKTPDEMTYTAQYALPSS